MNQLKLKPATIKNTVFDLGAVLVHWSPEEIAQQFAQDEMQKQLLLDQVFHHQDWKRLDLGAITEQQAIQSFARNTALPLSRIKALLDAIKAYLTPKEETVALLSELHQQGHRLFCLSNICMEIFEHLASRYTFFDLFEDIIVSAEVKLAKPDPEIFKYMLNRFDILPEETLFIDDLPANVESANNLGIQAIRFTEIADCRRAMARIID
ncbi:MAG: HAD family phosphatase [Pseudomonadales bacterium]|nr:HAD family phosphatase [Pseudomonadales bacterium]